MKIAIKRTLIMVLMILMVITLVPNAGLGGKVYAESVYKHFTVGEFDYYESDITDGYASASGYSKGVGVSTYNVIFIAMATVNFRIIASVIIMTAKRMNISGPGILFFTDIIQTNT